MAAQDPLSVIVHETFLRASVAVRTEGASRCNRAGLFCGVNPECCQQWRQMKLELHRYTRGSTAPFLDWVS